MKYATVPSADELDTTVRAAARRARALAPGAPLEKILEVSETAIRLSDSAYYRLRLELGEPPPVACKAGCWFCCRAGVGLTPPEAIRIAEHLRATWSAEELARLRRELAARSEKIRGLSGEEHARSGVTCAFLDERGACSIYEVRPLSCRAWTSVDPELCKDLQTVFQREQYDTLLYGSKRAALYGIMVGLSDAGLAASPEASFVELMYAVLVALDTPQAAERWLAGEAIFGEALQ